MIHMTSRGSTLPRTEAEMRAELWFNMWRRLQWPYSELVGRDILYWYESVSGRVKWETVVTQVDRFRYGTKKEAAVRLAARFGDFDRRQDYWCEAPSEGFCLAWKVEPKKKLELSKPAGFKFPGLGWLRGDVAVAKGWVLGSDEVEEGLTLDEIVPEGEIRERLASANAAMEGVNPQRIAAIVRLTLRRDTRLVQALKMYRDYRCQFPNCGVRITKRGGGYYIQVAHIKPVSAQGRSQLGNLVVLCPNHHSEFDYGDLVILEQGDDLLCGTLNGVRFEISLA